MLRDKCRYTQDGTILKPCETLCEVIETGDSSNIKSGIWHIERSANGEFLEKSYIAVKGGRQKFEPLLFNFCPFCGEEIYPRVL